MTYYLFSCYIIRKIICNLKNTTLELFVCDINWSSIINESFALFIGHLFSVTRVKLYMSFLFFILHNVTKYFTHLLLFSIKLSICSNKSIYFSYKLCELDVSFFIKNHSLIKSIYQLFKWNISSMIFPVIKA